MGFIKKKKKKKAWIQKMDCRQVLKSILTDLIQRSKQENPPLVIEMNKTEKKEEL